MSWNHRVIAKRYIDGIYFGIHEVYYNDSGKPTSATLRPIELSDDSLESLKWSIDEIKKCLDQPVLTITETGKVIEYKPQSNESND